MTRRTWLQRAFASAAFVAGAQFATLVDRPQESKEFQTWLLWTDGSRSEINISTESVSIGAMH